VVTGGGGNTSVRVTSDGLILVDSKNLGDQFYNALMEQVKIVSNQPVRAADGDRAARPVVPQQTMNTIYHITSSDEVATAAQTGSYVPGAFADEGFIHCSYAHQIRSVANRRFIGRSDLALLEIDRSRLSCDVLDENLEGGTDLFPHIYGRLPMAAVVRVHPFPCSADGRFELPRLLEAPS
jgi:uncharacterized protein (DUF952 family)